MRQKLPTVTLLGVDCVDIDRLVQAAEICQKDFDFGKVKLLTSLPAQEHGNIVPIAPITSVEEYSQFTITRLHEYVDTSHVLIIQYDGFILNPEAWSNEFLAYDYIGAPWVVTQPYVKNFGFPKETLGTLVVGNGGFSLRSKKLLKILSQMHDNGKIENYHPEDLVICVQLRKELESQGITFAPAEVAKKFAIEVQDGGGNFEWTNQLGFHGLKWTDISKWLKQHPEYDIDNTLNRNR